MYDPLKAAQVIAYLALKSGERALHVVKAIKLVYLADRENLQRYALPILDEPRYSLPKGPVNSLTYNFIRGEEDPEASGWSSMLADLANHRIGVRDNIFADDLEELSDAEIETLDHIWQRFGAMNEWELVAWTHNPENVPEWEDPRGSSQPIPLERMMRAVNVPNPVDRAQFLRDHSDISLRLGARQPLGEANHTCPA